MAVTPILSRLFERMLYDKYIKKHYNTYISSEQFGFRQNSSTCSALIILLHDLYSLRKKHNYTRVITLDMSKAFDTIQHSEIFKEISRFVPLLNEYVVGVLKCFLTSLSHYTSLGSRFSPPASTNWGVPQGTITGPIFFNYAVNDTFLCEFSMSPSARITVYADDNTSLIGGTYTGGDNAFDIIHRFGDHFCSKNLSFNADKSSEMLFNLSRHDVPLISGIDRKSSFKLLGILFDEKLSFNHHVKCITKRVTAILYVVFRLRRFRFSIREPKLLYKTLVLPTLTYCCSVWGRNIWWEPPKDWQSSVYSSSSRDHQPVHSYKRHHSYLRWKTIQTVPWPRGESCPPRNAAKKSHRSVRFTRK